MTGSHEGVFANVLQNMTVHVAIRSLPTKSKFGGMEKAAVDHIRGLREQGLRVCVHCPIEPLNAPWQNVMWPAWDSGPGRPTFPLAYALWARRLAKSLQHCTGPYDVVHLHGASSLALRWLPKSVTRRAVVNPHGMEEFGQTTALRTLSRLPLRRYARIGARSANVVIATDRSMRDVVLENLGPLERVVTIPNSVDVAEIDKLGQSPYSPERQFPTCLIVSVGRLVYNKGYDLLANAMRELAASRHGPASLSWTHYGTGPEIDAVSQIMENAPKVTFRSVAGASDSEVQTAMKHCSIFVQPSRYEGSSLTVLEAMTHGCLVVATPVGGIPDKIIDGQTGCLAREASSPALVQALQRASQLGKEAMGQAARTRVEHHFSLTATSVMYKDLYAELVRL